MTTLKYANVFGQVIISPEKAVVMTWCFSTTDKSFYETKTFPPINHGSTPINATAAFAVEVKGGKNNIMLTSAGLENVDLKPIRAWIIESLKSLMSAMDAKQEDFK